MLTSQGHRPANNAGCSPCHFPQPWSTSHTEGSPGTSLTFPLSEITIWTGCWERAGVARLRGGGPEQRKGGGTARFIQEEVTCSKGLWKGQGGKARRQKAGTKVGMPSLSCRKWGNTSFFFFWQEQTWPDKNYFSGSNSGHGYITRVRCSGTLFATYLKYMCMN